MALLVDTVAVKTEVAQPAEYNAPWQHCVSGTVLVPEALLKPLMARPGSTASAAILHVRCHRQAVGTGLWTHTVALTAAQCQPPAAIYLPHMKARQVRYDHRQHVIARNPLVQSNGGGEDSSFSGSSISASTTTATMLKNSSDSLTAPASPPVEENPVFAAPSLLLSSDGLQRAGRGSNVAFLPQCPNGLWPGFHDVPQLLPPTTTLDDAQEAMGLYGQWVAEGMVALRHRVGDWTPLVNHYWGRRWPQMLLGRHLFFQFVLPHLLNEYTQTGPSDSVKRSILMLRVINTQLVLRHQVPRLARDIIQLDLRAAQLLWQHRNLTDFGLDTHVQTWISATLPQGLLGQCARQWTLLPVAGTARTERLVLHPWLLLKTERYPGTPLPVYEALTQVLLPQVVQAAYEEHAMQCWFRLRQTHHFSQDLHARHLAQLGRVLVKEQWSTKPTTLLGKRALVTGGAPTNLTERWLFAALSSPYVSLVPLSPLQSEIIRAELSDIHRLQEERLERRRQNPEVWYPPETPAERRERHSHLSESIPTVPLLLTRADDLHVPPCMRRLLLKGQQERHLLDEERLVVGSWVVAMQPFNPTVSDVSLAVQILGGQEGQIAPTHLSSMTAKIKDKRQDRLKYKQYDSYGCSRIIQATLNSPQRTVGHCPYATAGGSELACQRACHNALWPNEMDTDDRLPLRHPLDHVAKALSW